MSEQYKSKILFDESSPDIQTEQEKELTSQISFDEDKSFYLNKLIIRRLSKNWIRF